MSLTYGLSLSDDILMLIHQRPVDANPLIGNCILPVLLPQAVVTLSRWLHLAQPNDHVLRLHLLQYPLHVIHPCLTPLLSLKLKPYERFFPTRFLVLSVQTILRRMMIQLLPLPLTSTLKKNTMLRPLQHQLILLLAWAILSGAGRLLMTRNSPI